MNSLEIFLKPWSEASTEAFCIRRTVFVEEQQVPEDLELDEYDPLATHALAYFDELCVGTARLVDLGDGHAQIGRMAVLAHFRGKGIGKQILEKLLLAAKVRGFSTLILHSQLSVMPFYEKLGFIAQGPIYDEAGILHRNMMLILPNSIE
ncbi:GNAT family N-acetyltransferase [Polynucleobacter wuianus]|uniref:GNAT family N-acetyltransferase n=1 Tax=Polynucleobacter wuianus TaxID=1743168 RepID=UPI001C0CC38F|nr:GNAT family N-acetyltransferase [Polynucleobacter wuianus]MBU3608943.1 GNAT family N-acetyltransferase [Polynucleobacter wuianus]